MAKFENEGYCPNNVVEKKLAESDCSRRLSGMWALIGASVVCDEGVDDRVNEMFTTDAMAMPLIERIIRRNVNADKIMVFQSAHRSLREVENELREDTRSELISAPGSNFLCVLADADYGLKLTMYDLRNVVYYER